MKTYKYFMLALVAATLLSYGCDDENLFDTIEAPPPTVTDTDWSATVLGETVAFAEGGRVFRLTNPLDTPANYRDILFKAAVSSNDSRTIDSIAIELQHIPSLPSNAPQGWSFHDAIKIPAAEQSTTYNFEYNLNFEEFDDTYWGGCGPGDGCGPGIIASGAFGITREDNTIRLGVFFNDGSSVRLAQVQFSYPITEAGEE